MTQRDGKDRALKRVMGAVGKAHTAVYRRTGGRIGGRFRGGDVVLLTVTGRKSGRRYTYPLMFVRDDDAYVVAASNGGIDREPGWWLNLRANPVAELQHGRSVLQVSAGQVSGDERARLWQRLNEMYAGYDDYQAGVQREIAVVRLTPSA